jgi:hypothetical protein
MDWAGRLRHDLLKRALWAAIDAEEEGDRADPAPLRRALLQIPDDEGQPVPCGAIWRRFLAEAPASDPARAVALDAFELAVDEAEAAARALDGSAPATRRAIAAVRALDAAFAPLAPGTATAPRGGPGRRST